MEHALFIQKVKPEHKETYLEAHRKAWPDLLQAIRAAGVEREMIWIQDETLYIYIMAEHFDEAMARLGQAEIFQKWVEQMEPLLADMQDYSEGGKIVKLEKIFDLEEQI